jgi:hypothetical protein
MGEYDKGRDSSKFVQACFVLSHIYSRKGVIFMNSSNDFLCRHNPFCGHSSSCHDKSSCCDKSSCHDKSTCCDKSSCHDKSTCCDKSSCCDKAKDKGHKQKRSSPIGQACQTRQQISEFLRTSIIGSIIGFTTTAEPFTPIFVELRSFDAVTGQVIVTDRAMGNFTISLSSICSVKTICPATTQPMFNA